MVEGWSLPLQCSVVQRVTVETKGSCTFSCSPVIAMIWPRSFSSLSITWIMTEFLDEAGIHPTRHRPVWQIFPPACAGTVYQMVTGEAAVGIIRGPLCLSISMDESVCASFVSWYCRSRTPAQGLQLQLMSELCKLPHAVLTVITSSLPAGVAAIILSTQPEVEIKGPALCLWVSLSDICRRLWLGKKKKRKKSPHSRRLLGVCLWSLATHGRLPNLFVCLTFPI